MQEELRVVALAFCEQDSNVSIDVESKTLSTSRIFYWYANDFGNSTEEVLARIGEMWLRGERKAVEEGLSKFFNIMWSRCGQGRVLLQSAARRPHRV